MYSIDKLSLCVGGVKNKNYWHEYLGGLHGEAVQARSMEFAVLTDRDVLTSRSAKVIFT